MFRTLADLVYRRSWRIVIAAVVISAISGVFGGGVASLLRSGGFDDPGSQSIAALNQIERASGVDPYQGLVALIRTGQAVSSPATRAEVERVASTIRQDRAVGRVLTVYDTHNPAMVSLDRKSTYIVAQFKPATDTQLDNAVNRIKDRLSSDPHVLLGGGRVAGTEVAGLVGQDLARAELLAFPILFVLLLLVFRGLLAAFFPIVMGGLTIICAFLGLRLVNEGLWLSVFALNLVTGMGLGLSIDYSLLILSRYREELARVGPGREALQRTLSTAGRTVLFSSLTVTASLASLLVFPQRFLVSMGVGGILVTLIAATVALFVLPAVLNLLGPRVNALAPARWQQAAPPDRRGAWYYFSHFVMRYAAPIAAVTAILLIVLGLPFLRINFTSVDATVLPKSESARQVSDALQTQFPPNRTSPIIIAIQAPPGSATAAALTRYEASIRALPGVATVRPPLVVGDNTWEVDVISRASVYAGSSQTLVRDIRSLPAPFPVKVGGDTAAFVDQKATLAAHLPIALAIVALVTLVMLFLVTGSVVLPVKSLVMSLLTLSATFGLLVLIFQDGRLEGLLRYSGQGALESTQPILLFAIAFGLSTDYAVFLLSRIKEVHDSGVENTEAVALGLERTGRVVTAAALLFCVAIGAFTTSRIVFIKELGLGTALAVIIDATIVRALLVPALMKLLGHWNWWAPGPLQRLQEQVRLEQPSVQQPAG